MKAEDMPTPRIDRVIGASYRTLGEAGRALQREAEAVERELAVQTATAQSLRPIVERAVGLLNRWQGGAFHRQAPQLANDTDRFLAEIGARSAEVIQERK